VVSGGHPSHRACTPLKIRMLTARNSAIMWLSFIINGELGKYTRWGA
jgi:hypothetical protein